MARLSDVDVAIQVGYAASDEFVEAISIQLDEQFDHDQVDYARFEVLRTTNVGNLIESTKWEITDKSFDSADREASTKLDQIYCQFESEEVQRKLEDCVSEINELIESEEVDLINEINFYLESFIPQIIEANKHIFLSSLYLQEQSDALLKGYSYSEANAVALAELIKERNAQKELVAR